MGLTLGQRVRAAARAAVGIFSDDSARQAFGLLGGMWPSTVGEPPTKGARERIAAYSDMPWVFALADKVASAGAMVQWTLSSTRRGEGRAYKAAAFQRADHQTRAATRRRLKAAGELVEIYEHPLLDLLDTGNSMITGIALRKLLFLYWDLEGEVFLLKDRGPLSPIRSLWPIPPDWVRLTPTPSNQNYMVSFRGWQGWVPETEVLWLKNHNPSNPYARGTGFARALADELETDEYSARAIRMTFLNTSRPDFIVYPKGDATLTEPERMRLQEDWERQHQGFWRAFRARVASKEVGIYEFGATDFRRLQMTQLREFERDLIRQVWSVPPEIMGIVAPGASRATIDRSSYLFSRWVVVPRLELIRAILQERLVPEFDDRLVLDYVSPVQEDLEFGLEVGRSAPWTRTTDEWREIQHLDAFGGDAGARVGVPTNMTLQLPNDISAASDEPGTPADPQQLARLSTDELVTLRSLVTKMRGRPGAAPEPLLTDPSLGRGLSRLADAVASAARPRRRSITRDEDGLVAAIEED